MKKRVLSLILVFVMVLGMLPGAAWAAEEQDIAPMEAPTVVTVNFTAQEGGAFLFAPQFGVDVAGDLAESYGYEDSVADGVSALDVLVKAHEIKYGGSFTKDTAANYLTVSGGSPTKAFENGSSYSGFVYNGIYPMDSNGQGTLVGTQAVNNGDMVEFFTYGSNWDDRLVWFSKGASVVDSLTVRPGAETELTIKGIVYMAGYSYSTPELLYDAGEAVEGAKLTWVDETTGALTDIESAVTDAEGKVTVTAPSTEGTYYLSAYAPAEVQKDDGPVIMTLLPIIVDTNAPEEVQAGPCDLEALSVADFNSNPNALTMTPAFDSDITEYSVAAVDYQSAAYMSMCYVKATAVSGSAEIKAKLNDGTEKTLTSGNTTFENFGTKDILQPGVNNKLVITVTNNGNSKTYTVTIPMKDADGNLPGTEPDPEPGSEAAAVMDNLAAKYAASGVAGDSNAPWLAADMAAYAMAFPDTAHKLTDAQKQDYLDVLIPAAAAATGQSDLAKYIIAFRAMGYDARKVITADGQTVDVVKKLTDQIDAQAAEGTTPGWYEYTLPYVLIALQQGQDYATAEQLSYLKETAISIKDAWQATTWGTDGATPMILALAPYYSEADIKVVVDEGVAAVKAKQSAEDGSINQNAASTGLALAALAAVGENPADVKADGSDKSLVDGLMTQVSDTGDGFKPTSNTFATEQGFRGLAAMALQKKANGPAQVYNFISLPMNPARVSAANCPVEFSVVPADAKVEVKQGDEVQTANTANYYDLAAGSYTYTVSKEGYRTAGGAFEVTADDAAAHTKKDISVSLVSQPSGGESDKDLTITVKVLTHDENACEGKWTYKANANKYTTVIANTTVTVKAGQTAFDAFALAMEKEEVSYTEKTSGYISEIAGHEEFGHNSPNSGWQYMIGSTLPDVSSRDYVLKSNATITWFYTDDYTKEKGSEQWSGSGSSGSGSTTASEVKVEVKTDENGTTTAEITLPKGKEQAVVKVPVKDAGSGTVLVVVDKDGNETILKKAVLDGENMVALVDGSCTVKVVDNAKTFEDTVDHWAEEAVTFAASRALFNGTGETTFSPDLPMDRAMLATVLYRLEDAVAKGENPFEDVTEDVWYTEAVTWASTEGIVNGYGDGVFGPADPITREQMAAMLYRYAKAIGLDVTDKGDMSRFDDADDVSQWADEAMTWAVGVGLIKGRNGTALAPTGTATRAEVAAVMERLVQWMVE